MTWEVVLTAPFDLHVWMVFYVAMNCVLFAEPCCWNDAFRSLADIHVRMIFYVAMNCLLFVEPCLWN